MIALDTTALSLLFVPGATANSVRTGKPIKYAKERIEYFVDCASRNNERILIPTPALSELMVKLSVSDIDELLKTLKGSKWFRVESFDAAAAVELAVRTSKAISAGDKREGIQADYTKVRFDRQITCIAMVNGASSLVSDDQGIWAVCERWGPVTSLEDLSLPPELIAPPLLQGLEDEEPEAGAERSKENGQDLQPRVEQRGDVASPTSEPIRKIKF